MPADSVLPSNDKWRRGAFRTNTDLEFNLTSDDIKSYLDCMYVLVMKATGGTRSAAGRKFQGVRLYSFDEGTLRLPQCRFSIYRELSRNHPNSDVSWFKSVSENASSHA